MREPMSKLNPLSILIVVVVVAALGAMAWGLGWGAHHFIVPEATPSPTLPVSIHLTPIATLSPTPSTMPSSTPTPRPTSTAMPTPAPTAEEAWETVEPGEGIYEVCRRHCPGRWSYNELPDRYARRTAELNNLPWEPQLNEGQKLRMPPCPED